MLSRIKQFFLGNFYTIKPFTKHDKMFIFKYLTKDEIYIFNTMKKYDRAHCLRVSKDLIKLISTDKSLGEQEILNIMKASLLHDLGKREGNFYIIDRVLMVLISERFQNKKYISKYKKLDIYMNHAEIGYKILKQSKLFSDKVLYMVKNHHNNKPCDDFQYIISLFQQCDDRN
ncbi:HDIG domain-containing metalloprotein [Hathewaya histolytica]|uniref:HDIG domain-containing metalloprotein n=1 Tax=Hathewaya histolytica TaxID=1498 RepID=UPI003B67260A